MATSNCLPTASILISYLHINHTTSDLFPSHNHYIYTLDVLHKSYLYETILKN